VVNDVLDKLKEGSRVDYSEEIVIAGDKIILRKEKVWHGRISFQQYFYTDGTNLYQSASQ